MITGITHATIAVSDYDEAIAWYTQTLGLELRGDHSMGDGQRFVTVGVSGQDVEIVLHKAVADPAGDGAGRAGAVHGLVFGSDDCRRDVRDLRSRGVKFTMDPQDVPWGVQAVFEDPYGNSHVLVEARSNPPLQRLSAAELAGPEGVLSGIVKGMRHGKVRKPEGIRFEAFARLVRQAYELGGG